jgi:sigma-B regulation protein RsbU (phosphoserine phosphatase)
VAKKEGRPYEFIIKELELEVQDRERQLQTFKQELVQINTQLEKFIDQMSEQLRLAHLIQKALVPTETPTIPGFEFSTKFLASFKTGGDYFDIFEHEDKMKFGILMANSTGHGMASLFLSILLKLTAQIEAKRGFDPSQVLKKMNEELQAKIKDSQGCHIFYSVVDRRDFQMTYSKSGNVLSYLYKNDADKIIKLESTQEMIEGKKLTFKNESIVLDPRDKLIVISQGLLKLKNKKGELFSEDKLLKKLLDKSSGTPHEIRNEIVFQVKKFIEGTDLIADVSVVVIKVKDKIVRLRHNASSQDQ